MTPVPDEEAAASMLGAGGPVEALRDENAALQRQVERLTRRRDSLLGERSVLERLLADRERRIGVLQRETGRPRGPLAAWIDRLRHRAAAWLGGRPLEDRQAALAAAPVAAGAAADLPLVPFVLDGRAPRVIAIAVFGLPPEALEKVVEEVEAGLRGGLDLVPLFLTGSPEFAPFRRRHLLFEYLPSPERQRPFLPDLDWDTYLLRRLALLRRIWQPARILAFGPSARAVLEQWLDSPFEDETISSVIHPISDVEEMP